MIYPKIFLSRCRRWLALPFVLLFVLTACSSAATPTVAPSAPPAATAATAASTATRAATGASPTANAAAATVPRASATRTAASTRTAESTRTASAVSSPRVAASPSTTVAPSVAVSTPTPVVPGPTPTVPGPPVPVPPVVTSPSAAQGNRAIRQVSAANPLRMYVAGDSFAEWLGADLTSFGQRSGVVSTSTDGKISSGLANPTFFDWPTRLSQAVASNRPDVVVIILGANDLNGVSSSAGYFAPGTPGWMAEYGRRQGEIMDIVGKSGAQLYWISQPPMRDPGQNNAAHAVNESALAQIATRPWVHYVDSWTLFSDRNGNYAAAMTDVTGRTIILRQDDGLHLSREGTTWLASAAYTQIRRDWQLP